MTFSLSHNQSLGLNASAPAFQEQLSTHSQLQPPQGLGLELYAPTPTFREQAADRWRGPIPPPQRPLALVVPNLVTLLQSLGNRPLYSLAVVNNPSAAVSASATVSVAVMALRNGELFVSTKRQKSSYHRGR